MVHSTRPFQFTLCSALCGFLLFACQAVQPQQVRPKPLPQDPLIEVYTNHDPASEYTEPYRSQTRSGNNLEQKVIEAIQSATSTIDLAVQELRLPHIAHALRDRAQAGVKVRVILENSYARPYSSFTEAEIEALDDRTKDRYSESRQLIDRNGDQQLSPDEINEYDALVVLDRAQIPRIDDTEGGTRGNDLMHHKFMVIDGHTVLFTSSNFTLSDMHGDLQRPVSRGNANNLLKIESRELAQLFTQEFALMWGDGVGGRKDSVFGAKKPDRPPAQVKVGDTTVTVQFSPSRSTIPWAQTTNGSIAATLGQAKKSIDLALFVFSEQPLVDTMEPLSQQGVTLRALIEPGFIDRPYSEALDMMGVTLSDRCKIEAQNRPWSRPIQTVGTPFLPPGDLLHHKFAIVDRQTVITGSHNWTNAANRGNDEAILIIPNATVAAHYQREFDRLYQGATLGIPPALQRKIDGQKESCPNPVSKPNRESASHKVQSTQPVHQPTNPSIASDQPSSQRVNLNTATQAEIEALPGIGPSLARRIISARDRQPFTSLDDLDRVSGIGPKLLEKLRDRVTW